MKLINLSNLSEKQLRNLKRFGIIGVVVGMIISAISAFIFWQADEHLVKFEKTRLPTEIEVMEKVYEASENNVSPEDAIRELKKTLR